MADPDPLSLIDATADQVSARVVELGEAATGLRNRSPVGVLRGIWETIALVVRRLYDAHVTPMYVQADRARATGPWLRMHAAYLAVTPRGAQATTGRVTAISATTVTIASGVELTAGAAAQRLVVTAETEAPAGVAVTVPVRAAVAGAAGNVAPGAAVSSKAYPDVAFSLPNDWITQTGSDGEIDDALRRRVDDRWASLGDGYPPAQYRYLAEGVPGVKRAIVLRAPRGFGSADVVIVAEAAVVPPPALLDAVRAALEDHRMICRDLRILGAAIVPIRIQVLFEGGGYTPAQVAAAIEQGMDGAIEGGGVHVADIYAAAVDGLPGLTYFGVSAPLHDIGLGPGSVPDLSVTATMGRLPPTHVPGGGTGSSSAGPEPITDSLAYGKLVSGALVPQAPQTPLASGRWALTLPALAAGETWYIGPFAAGTELAGVASYGVDDRANWSRRADGVWTYGAAATVPAGVVMDVEVTARRA